MKYPIALLTTLLLTGCATPLINYNPEQLPGEQLVTVSTDNPTYMEELFTNQYSTFISTVYNAAGTDITSQSRKWNTGAITEVTLAPGTYLFVGSCLNGNRYAYPRQVFNLEAGKHYELYCDIQREKGFLGIPADKSAMLGIRDLTVTDLVTAQEDTP